MLFDLPVEEMARSLLGYGLYSDGVGGQIVETEAYGPDDPACHAWRGRTARNAPLFGPPGTVYVYRSYGIHLLLNLVAEPEGTPGAVLIRALAPDRGEDVMRNRRCRSNRSDLCSGPGKVGEALDVDLSMSGKALEEVGLVLEPPIEQVAGGQILSGGRIGISSATEVPWRFHLHGSEFVSRPWIEPRA